MPQASQHSLEQAGIGRADRLKAHGLQHICYEAGLQLQQPRGSHARGQHSDRGILALSLAACACPCNMKTTTSMLLEERMQQQSLYPNPAQHQEKT